MDMWTSYISATRAFVPDADGKIALDELHIAKHLGDAVDRVRRDENRELRAEGDDRLLRTKYWRLRNPGQTSDRSWQRFAPLRRIRLKVARAWTIKESAMALWGYGKRGWSERMWGRWYSWAFRSRLDPIKRVAQMTKSRRDGVMNAATSNLPNARSEGMNSKIQWIERMASGYRNRNAGRMRP